MPKELLALHKGEALTTLSVLFQFLKGIIGMSDKKWHSGWPKEPGWYNCLLDGEMEMQLKYYVCQVAMKPHWVDANGDYIESMAHVQWSSKADHER